MEIELPSKPKTGHFAYFWSQGMLFLQKFKAWISKYIKKTMNLAQEDPRRVIHSVKTGLALTLVSLLYYCRALYNAVGISAMCALITVIAVFEFSVGGTLDKAVNRGFATILGCSLGIGVHYLSSFFGGNTKPIFLGFFAFLLCTATSFVRFFPRIKARYDNGVVAFILTFIMISLSGYRVDDIVEVTYHRFFTIVIGAVICVVVSIFICPVWAGEDLHNLIALNVEKLGNFLAGFEGEYFKIKDGKIVLFSTDDKPYDQLYNTVLDSGTIEESQANLATWEPPHGDFRFGHPWKQYLKIGNRTRECCYQIDTLNTFLHSDIQAQIEFNRNIYEGCKGISFECGKALNALALSIRTTTLSSTYDDHVQNSKAAAEKLKSTFKTSFSESNTDLLDIITATTVTSMLSKIVAYTEEIANLVQELAHLSHFKMEMAKNSRPGEYDMQS